MTSTMVRLFEDIVLEGLARAVPLRVLCLEFIKY